METTSTFSLLELFELGGVIMWPLLVFSIAVVAISIERIVFLLYHNLKTEQQEKKVSEFISNNDYEGAAFYLREKTKRHMAARIFLTLIGQVKPGQPVSERRIEKAAEGEAMSCITSLENGFNFLVALGSLSPLTGFLGTVTGMIGAFRSIAEATEVNAQIVANGIYEALITTVFGLIIAIIAMVSHSIFSHIVDKFTLRAESSCGNLIEQIIDSNISSQNETDESYKKSKK